MDKTTLSTACPLIYERLANIMASITAIGKNSRNAQQGFMFRGIDDVMNELHDAFTKAQVFILPSVQSYYTEDKPTKSGGTMTYTRATIAFQFMTTDGSSVTVTTVGEASDSGDKSMNKAMSIALKYALLQLFLIPTKEDKDPDAQTPPPTDPVGQALSEIGRATTREVLNDIHARYHRMAGYAERVLPALQERGKELGLQSKTK